MSDRVKLAREIAARAEPRFIEVKPEPRPRPKAVCRTRRGGGRVRSPRQSITAMRGGLTAEEYRRKFIRKWGKH